MERRTVLTTLGALVAAAAVGCSSNDAAPTASTPSSTEPTPSGGPSSPSPSSASPSTGATPSGNPTRTPESAHPVSLPALTAKKYDGRNLRLDRVLARNAAYTRHHVTYASGSLTISGILNVPSTPGPHPAVVLNHGYIDPAVYTTGRGLAREQDYLARRGYVVLHTDYRNHAQSSKDPRSELNLRLGYTEDSINAVLALRTSQYVDPERIGMLGRSMGGGVTLNALVAQPGLVKAGIVFASISSNTVENFERWPPGPANTAAILRAYGEPARNPEFWRNVSPVTFFDRVTEPVLLHHGESDSNCPIAWSRRTLSALTAAGKKATLYTYPGEEHAFVAAWPTSMSRTVAFLKQQGV
ncbi:alpha/beta hydrolase family protein [Kribbella sp. NPDC058245]|uniref:alpha/beta hydrolase family protein n=1 Tax=Kribbella sp. NPDC058245 TaxID=3346399 RepID=UPI0036E9714E